MDQNEYKFISYQPEYKSQVFHLLSVLWDDDQELNSAYFDWKYLNNPNADSVRLYLALHDGEVVGVRGFFGMAWHTSWTGRKILCLADVDAVVHRDHRRKGLLQSMTFFGFENIVDSPYEYSVTLSANRISASFNLNQGWQNVGFVETAQRLKVADPGSQSRLRQIGRNIPLLRTTYRRLRSRPDTVPPESPEPKSTFDVFDSNVAAPGSASNVTAGQSPDPDAMAELVRQCENAARMRVVRDPEYFAWRYQNPRSSYRFLFSRSQQLDGYLVLRSRANAGDGSVLIADWRAKSPRIYAELLQSAIKLGDFLSITIWTETLSMEQRQMLEDNGFEFSDFSDEDDAEGYPPLILFRPLPSNKGDNLWEVDGLDLLDIRNWDIQAIDSDGH